MKKPDLSSVLVTTLVLILGVAGQAQQPARVLRIGYLAGSSAFTNSENIEAFRKRLSDLGYVEGKNIEIVYRYAEGKSERLSQLAAELVQLQVAVIVTSSTAASKAAKQATTVIPIVVATAGDLVGEGLAASLARPAGNLTGLTAISPDLSGKRLEILKETVPIASRVAVIWHRNPNDEREVKETEIAAKVMGVKLQSLPVQSSDEFQNTFAAMRKERAGALIIIQGPLLGVHRKRLFELAATNRLPSICDAPSWTEEGCLMSYGPNRTDMFRRAADYVDKILKGRKPDDLPVEQPMKFEFIVNLKTAKQIGLTVPPNVLVRADKVIR
jgi:putative ABC transport system substrate-binding protein